MLGIDQHYGWGADSLKTGWSESLTKKVTFQPRQEDSEGMSEPWVLLGAWEPLRWGQQVQRSGGGSSPGMSQGHPVQWLRGVGEGVKG